MSLTTQGPHDASADGGTLVPGAIEVLLARVGWVAAAAHEISVLPDAAGARRTLRVALVGGRVVKARVLRNEDVVARIARWVPRLPAPGFAPLLAAGGRATLETWIDGVAVAPEEDETVEEAGALLGACHATLPGLVVEGDAPLLQDRVLDVLRHLEHLETHGVISPAHAERIRRVVHDSRPRAATWGLAHGDFSPENLVRSAVGAVVCVDNTTVRPGLLERDLGFLWNRWPMPARRRERFLAAYRRRADPGPFLAHERFFRIGSALRSAYWRAARGAPGLALPLAEISSLVS